MARKLSSGYVYKNQRLGKWRLAISWQDDDGRQHKMTRSTQVPCYEDKVGRNGKVRRDNRRKGAAEFAIMRRACLLYLADHGNVDAIRHDVVSIVLTGGHQAKLRHLIGAWQWAESRE